MATGSADAHRCDAVKTVSESRTTMRAYPHYRDFGVEWLGEVPEHWTSEQLGRLGSFSKGSGGTKEDEVEDGVPCVRYGDLYTVHQFHIKETRANISEDSAANYTAIRYGDLLFAGSGETLEEIGKSASNLVGGPAYCGGDVILFRPSIETEATFLGYAADCAPAAYQKACMGRGVTVMHIYSSELKYMVVPLPPLDEQRAIAAFLDRETERIDALVEKKRLLIERLEEYRTALITRTVTRGLPPEAARAAGLDPSPRLKASGAEWLGVVPEHWEVKALKWETPVQRGASPRPIDDEAYFDNDGSHAWVRIADVTAAGMYLNRTTQRLSELGVSLSVPLEPGELVLSIAGSVGKPCITKIDCCIHDGFVYFPQWTGDVRYLFYVFASGEPYKGLGKLGTQLNLNTDTVGSISVAIPPVDEQAAIADYLTTENAEIESSLESVREAVERLQEFRAALITAAVTGKIDVREAAQAPVAAMLA